MANSSARDAAAVRLAERAKQALGLRRAGASYEQIGAQLGITRSAARKVVTKAIARIPRDDAEQVLQLELDRLDALLRGLWPQAVKGHGGAVDRVLRVMERRARLLGLDAPTKRELSGPAGGPISVADVTQLTDEQLEALVHGDDTAADTGSG